MDADDQLIVDAWIKNHQKDRWSTHPKCHRCGWPHDGGWLCGMGATFGEVVWGESTYYIDSSNVDSMLEFLKSYGGGFHWKNDIHFIRKKSSVEVLHLEEFNNTPQVKRWEIPLNEWTTIVDQMKVKP